MDLTEPANISWLHKQKVVKRAYLESEDMEYPTYYWLFDAEWEGKPFAMETSTWNQETQSYDTVVVGLDEEEAEDIWESQMYENEDIAVDECPPEVYGED